MASSLPDEIMMLVANEWPVDAIADFFEIPVDRVRDEIARSETTGKAASPAAYVPSPEQIRQSCLAIQAGWDDEEFERRKVIHNPPAMTPTIAALPGE